MPIKSYLAYPVAGRFQEMLHALEALPECSVLPADNAEVAILVSDTGSSAEERELTETLQTIKSISCLALTFGDLDSTEAIHEELG